MDLVKPAANGGPDVTVVMSPRERFSGTLQSIASLYENAGTPFAFVCVDGGSPRSVRRPLAEACRQRGARLIRTDHYLTPNEARNLGLREVTTTYVAFVDNDVEFAPGWLAALRQCAEETGADLVTPVICIGEPAHSCIHFAGGHARIVVEGGQRVFREAQKFLDQSLSDVRDGLVRETSELVEFHCVLARRDVFDRFGPLDENFTSMNEHVDLALTVRAGGGRVMFEPNSVVTYAIDTRPRLSDLPYFFCRWCDEWSVASELHFDKKWGTTFNVGVPEFVKHHRRKAWASLRRSAQMVVGWRRSYLLYDRVAAGFGRLGRRRRERALARAARRRQSSAARLLRDPLRDAAQSPRRSQET